MVNAGELNKRVTALTFATITGGYEWQVGGKLWAKVQCLSKSNLFSSVGLSARTVELTIRKRTISPGDMLLYGTQNLYVTAVDDTEGAKGYLTVTTAAVDVVSCIGRTFTDELGTGNRPIRTEHDPIQFPAILTEKYMGYDREETHATNTSTYVLVTPKAVVMNSGDLVTVTSGAVPATYNVQICHRLDPVKNEYEMTLKKDVQA